MKNLKFTRKDNKITNVETGKVTTFESVNRAKKESRKLQMLEDGNLGRGCIMDYSFK